MSWEEDSKWESEWWGNCVNTLREEFLQFTYADRMGLNIVSTDRSTYNINVKGKSILDIGGGPVSLLLKAINLGCGVVVDPCKYPSWVWMRYKEVGIDYVVQKAEEMKSEFNYKYDEIWIYNVLQHTINPEKVVQNARAFGKIVRLFEWVDAGTSVGHPHELTEANLNQWLDGKGTVEQINEHGAIGKCYYGVFNGTN